MYSGPVRKTTVYDVGFDSNSIAATDMAREDTAGVWSVTVDAVFNGRGHPHSEVRLHSPTDCICSIDVECDRRWSALTRLEILYL